MPVLFSRACEYAIRGLAEMASQPEITSWTIQELAKQTDTPAPFLAKTFQTLVKSGILNSAKGRHGGFSFARPVDKIYIMEIVNILDGPTLANDCALGFPECSGIKPCPFHAQWGEIRETIIHALSSQSLIEFAQQQRG